MIFAKYSFPLFAGETEGGSAAPTGGDPAVADTPAPDALPAGQPSGAPKESAGDDNMDFVLEAFDQLRAEDEDLEELPSGETDGGQKAPAAQEVKEPEAAATATAAAKPKEPEAAVTPAPAPKAPDAPSASQTQEPPAAVPTLEPEKILEKLSDEVSKHRDVFQKVLAEQMYTMSPAELEEFTEDPGKVIGSIAAKVHVNVVESLSKMFAQQMPVYVHGLMQAKARNEAGEDKFWNANPHLDRSKHKDIVTQVAKIYRQMNPNVDTETFIRTVGAMAGGALGLTAQAAVAAANASANGTQVQTPGKVVRSVGSNGFTPAGVSTAPPNSQARAPLNPWDAFTREMEQIED